MIKNILFRFTPFKITFLDGEVLVKESEFESDLLPWCSLPDILFEDTQRRFVGLSFPVDIGKEREAQEFFKSQRSELLRYFMPQQAEQLPRYAGFGKNGRIEMMWSPELETGLRCEFASLFHGVWSLPDSGHSPAGYVLRDIQDLIAAHGLKLL